MAAEASTMPGEASKMLFASFDLTDFDNKAGASAFVKRCNKIGQVAHVALVGRRFSSKNCPAFKTDDGLLELETIVGGMKTSTLIPPQEIVQYLMQDETDSDSWDPDDEERLLGLYAAQLRWILNNLGLVEGEHYVLYCGGFASIAGLSRHAHCQDFAKLLGGINIQDPDVNFKDSWASGPLVSSPDEMNAFKKFWHNLPLEDRGSYFKKIAEAPPANERHLAPMDEFFKLHVQQSKPSIEVYSGGPLQSKPSIEVYSGGPLTTLANFPPEVSEHVKLIVAMSGAWNGSLNLLGTCFNNAVDIEATKVVLGGKFSKAIIVNVPTETCKAGVTFTPTTARLAELLKDATPQKGVEILTKLHEQWTAIQHGKCAPLFDCVPLLPLKVLHENCGIVEVTVIFGKNQKGLGTMFENIGMTFEVVQPGALELQPGALELLPGKIYATLPTVGPDMQEAFEKDLSATFQ